MIRTALLILLFASQVSAQSLPKRIGHFVAKHQLATALVVTGLSFAAESASAIHCHQTDPGCYYTPNASGLHYTPTKIAGFDALMCAGVMGLEVGTWHWGETVDPEYGHRFVWFGAAPIVVEEVSATVRNTRPADTDLDSFEPK